ncbi:hypothetical protein BG32_03030 [Mesotoga sp. HF07.pep.5.2.highcov]|nr:hypothetical protein BG32_03030 [Mesotoga sp. HF07.pep.5.2.highcov]
MLSRANSRSPLQKEIDTLFFDTAARLRTKTLIAGKTACLKRFRLIAQKNNKKCMILNRITNQEARLQALHFLPGSEAPASLTAVVPNLSLLFLEVRRIVYGESANVSTRRRD